MGQLGGMVQNHARGKTAVNWKGINSKVFDTTLPPQYFTEDMIYDTNWCPDGSLSNSTGIEAWWDQEHIPYNLAFDNTTFNQVCAWN